MDPFRNVCPYCGRAPWWRIDEGARVWCCQCVEAMRSHPIDRMEGHATGPTMFD
jgi:hypothetical protein